MSEAQRFDVETVARQIGELVTHPQYQAIIEELERAPEHERGDIGRRVATREELIRRGIPLPDGFRVALRWFEDPDTRWPVTEVMDRPVVPVQANWTVCGSVGFYLCASVGYGP